MHSIFVNDSSVDSISGSGIILIWIIITFEDSFNYNRDLIYYVNSGCYVNVILLYIVNLMHIQLNESKDKYCEYSDNYYDTENRNLVSIDKNIVYKKITTTRRKRTIAQKKKNKFKYKRCKDYNENGK